MKRGVFVLTLILILSVSLVSANIFSDIWAKITGKTITGQATLIEKSTITVTAGDQYSSTYPAQRTIDKDLTTYWLAIPPNWISFEFDSIKSIEKIKMQGHGGWLRGLRNYTIQKKSGEEWVDVVNINKTKNAWTCDDANIEKSNPDVSLVCSSGYDELVFPPISTNSIKINIDQVDVYNNYYIALYEVWFYEAEVIPPTPPCENECSPSGSKECAGNSWKQCGNYDSDSCLEWSSLTPCADGQTCQNGNCITLPSCTDTDNSVSTPNLGTLTLTTKNTPGRANDKQDYCININYVGEAYCYNNQASYYTSANAYIYCETNGHCYDSSGEEQGQEAKCVTNTCSKTGKITTSNENKMNDEIEERTETDKCMSPSVLRQFSCDSDNKITYRDTACQANQRCEQGECVSNQCTDTDGGANKNTAGKVTAPNTPVEGVIDACIGTTAVKEYSCNTAIGMMIQQNLACNADQTCRTGDNGGECRSNTCTDPDATDEQGNSRTLQQQSLIRGTTSASETNEKDKCHNSATVKEFYCHPTTKAIVSGYVGCSAGYTCQEAEEIGACVANQCTDTDNGQDTSTQGTVTSPNFATPKQDICLASNINYVTEYYCDSLNNGASTNLVCGTGKRCQGGKCVDNDCDDPDADYEHPERTASTLTSDNGDFIDACIPTAPNYVKEYSCRSDGTETFTNTFCGAGYSCQQGACIKLCRENECSYNDRCYSMGIKVEANKYCNIDGEIMDVKSGSETCINNFECASNICDIAESGQGTCLRRGFFRAVLDWLCENLQIFCTD